MRSLIVPALFALLVPHLVACGGGGGDTFNHPQCSDGVDNDGNGSTDFPDDPSCNSEEDTDEDGLVSAQCMDGRDNDGDGKVDYPVDPGCFARNQDDEADECPDGATCPQCADGLDNDGNGSTDYPDDSGGCDSASDTDEYTRNLAACGSNVTINKLPFDGHATGTLEVGPSSLTSAICGGAGTEAVYELRVMTPKVIVASTDNPGTTADTVMYIRGANCANNDSEMTCSDDVDTATKSSSITQSIATPGTYYLVVDAHDPAAGGAYDLTVKFLTGEGESCSGADDCGPGLVCRVFQDSPTKVCAKHVCEDGVDDDGDALMDYPNDPGCTALDDEDETDGCPGVGPDCPECGDGFDNDGDMKTDFGTSGDTTCTSASDASEACVSTDGVSAITTATVMGTTVGAANDVNLTCASTFTQTAPDKVFRLDVPALANLTIEADTSFDSAVALFDASCGGTALSCVEDAISEPEVLSINNLAAGTYYFVVDGYSSGSGTYSLNVAGKIQAGASCEGPLFAAGVLTCATGYACAGTPGSQTCQPSKCLDGLDNDLDGKIDFPNDPGCSDAGDNDEANPATPPVCANGMDEDNDTTIDWPADFGCVAASGTSEAFCTGETDAATLISAGSTTGTTTGLANDQMPSCVGTSSAPEKTYALQLPVPVQTLEVGSTGFDTVLSLKSVDCGTTLACDDEGGVNFGDSLFTLSNVAPGGYAVVVDGWSSNNGSFTLTVKGTVATGTPCSSPLFSGASPVLFCPANTTCSGTPKKCQ
jgi:hypothetical protein